MCIVDVAAGKTVGAVPAGHTTMAPVLSPDGKTLYVCNRFNNDVAFIDLASREEMRRVKVPREPVAAGVTPDGKFLLVANHLHAGRADVDVVASSVSVIDTATARVIKEIVLPNGSGLLRDVRISPDGKHACVMHLLSRFHLPTTQVERGWINSSAVSLIDLAELKLINTVLLDQYLKSLKPISSPHHPGHFHDVSGRGQAREHFAAHAKAARRSRRIRALVVKTSQLQLMALA